MDDNFRPVPPAVEPRPPEFRTGLPPAQPAVPPRPRYLLAGGLFILTFLSTTVAGATFGLNPGDGLDENSLIINGLKYSLPLMAILFSHEMGHYLFARRYRVAASLPYFIPFPFLTLNMFGTMGAVIAIRERIRFKQQLFDIGAAGPLAGFIVAAPCVFIGVALSPVQRWNPDAPVLMEGESAIYWLAKRLIHGQLAPGYDINTHPLAWAGWLGLLVTMLNMIPVGQLDGGHIACALFGAGARRLAAWFHRLLWVLGLTGVGSSLLEYFGAIESAGRLPYLSMWLFWALLLRIIGPRHPPIDDEHVPLSPGRRVVGFLCFAVGLASFMPIPLEQSPREPLNPEKAAEWARTHRPPAPPVDAPEPVPEHPALAVPRHEISAARIEMLTVPLADDADVATARKAQDAIIEAMRRVRGGDDFSRIARDLSADRGLEVSAGEVGWVRRGDIPKRLVDAALTLRAGEVRGPLRVPGGERGGWYVLRCLEVRTVGDDAAATNAGQAVSPEAPASPATPPPD